MPGASMLWRRRQTGGALPRPPFADSCMEVIQSSGSAANEGVRTQNFGYPEAAAI